jgi:hypothetical protein
MIKNKLILTLIFSIALLTACKKGLDTTKLAGRWKYTHVERPNASPPDSVTRIELEEAAPYIEFSPNAELKIIWDGKVLSQGKFKIEDNNIRFTENLEGGKTRTFPFFVSKLTDNDLIFETMGEEGSKVTAVKQK